MEGLHPVSASHVQVELIAIQQASALLELNKSNVRLDDEELQ